MLLSRFAVVSFGLLCAVLVYLVLCLALNKEFDHDEFEHVHSAWYVAQGDVPYRDFFQNHNPLLWYLIAPVLRLAGDQTGVLLFLRVVMFGVTLMVALTASVIAVVVSGRRLAGWFCFPLLLSSVLFISKSVEIRPDGPMVLMGMMAVYFFVRFLDSAARRDLVVSGLFASASFLFLQKAVVFHGVLSLALAVMAVRREVGWRSVFLFLMCLAVGPVLVLGYVASQGALGDYWLTAVLMHTRKLYSFSPWEVLRPAWNANAVHFVLMATGAVHGVCSLRVNRKVGFIAGSGLMLFLYVLGVKTPWQQYFMPAAVMLAIAVACFLVRLVEWVGSRGLVLGVAIIGLAAYRPVKDLLSFQTCFNKDQRILVDYVVRRTAPGDYVHDGNIDFNLFRRDLHYFWFSIAPRKNLDVYNLVTGGRYEDYHVCDLVAEKRPRVISSNLIHWRKCGLNTIYRRDPLHNLYWREDRPQPDGVRPGH
jgi:hypothetical protein